MVVIARVASACAAAWLATQAAMSPVGADIASGATIFEAKCVACHVQGGNILAPGKTLQMSALERDGFATKEAQVELLRKGKGQMPKYQGSIPKVSRLTDEELEDVAIYVLQRAGEKWK
mmetsp:Transcript_7559/g.23509  ORF Transcript_7559/g.23509 Transcript_7559/m.23509 type:complete len:119 (+) Transcript_7559:37-393(+)